MLDARQAVVFENELKVRAALRELNLIPDVLEGALRAGLGAAALCTASHPPGFPGIAMWAETIASLGEQLIPEGWRRDDRENYSTVVHNDGTLGIAVASGTSDTGRVNRHPTTRHAKGPVTQLAVERNAYLPFEHLPENPDAPTPIWLLLHYQADEQLRSELSFPVEIDKQGHVTAWGTRLILTPIALEPAVVRLDDEPVMPNIVIERLS